jgi:RNA polymerase sigma-70 factor, ECF subfamily
MKVRRPGDSCWEVHKFPPLSDRLSGVRFVQFERLWGNLVDDGTDTSVRLLRRHRDGDEGALGELLERQIETMRVWARGRLPRWARDEMNTDDLVQDALMRTVSRLDAFEPQHDGALQSYLRQAILHRIRDEIRRTRREPGYEELKSNTRAASPSPEDEAAAVELFEAYEAALLRLREEDREVIALRVDLELPYREIARITGKPSQDAAQMAVSRALVRLAREMGREE